jgi:hypothetical protein
MEHSTPNEWGGDLVEDSLFVISLITDLRNNGGSAQEMIESAPRQLVNEALVTALAWFDACLEALSEASPYVDYEAFLSSFSINIQSGRAFQGFKGGPEVPDADL